MLVASKRERPTTMTVHSQRGDLTPTRLADPPWTWAGAKRATPADAEVACQKGRWVGPHF